MKNALCCLLTLMAMYGSSQTLNGVVKSFSPEGLPEEKTYRKGILKGEYKAFYADNQKLYIKGQYDNDMKTGRWKYYKYTDTNIPFVFQYFTYVNDTLNGPFKKLSQDTVTEGAYFRNQLHGPWKQYTFQLTQSGDSMRNMVAQGEYREGVKAGHWKFFNEHGLDKEGEYYLGKMGGQWKFYSPYSSSAELMIEARYKNGLKDGREIQYFDYKRVPVPCKNPNAHNCFDHQKINIRKEAIYNKGKLQGPYTIKKEDGTLLAKGEYIEGEKVGKWQEWNQEYEMMMFANYFDGRLAGPVQFKDASGHIMISGSYNNNMKNSKWTWYNTTGKVVQEVTYKDGKLNGEWVSYSESGIKTKYMLFENDVLKRIVLFDKQGMHSVRELTIEYPGDASGFLSVEMKINRKDTTEYINYLYKPDPAIQPEQFARAFDDAIKSHKNCYREGTYEKYAHDLLLLSGNYTQDKKDGVWEYDFTKDVRWRKTFENGKLKKEYFFVIHGKTPFDGEYIVNYPGGGIHYNFRIKAGYRNGKSRYYDKKGVEIKVEKYKEGVLLK